MVVPRDSVFGRTAGAENAVVITGTHAGQVTVTGRGAGGEATAVAALSDAIAIARDRAAIVPAPVLIDPVNVRGLTDRQLAEAV
jgi:homoserine dehydrogenase